MNGRSLDNAFNQRRPPGFGPPELTDNEIACVEFLRSICSDRNIRPTLARVRSLRRLCIAERKCFALNRWVGMVSAGIACGGSNCRPLGRQR